MRNSLCLAVLLTLSTCTLQADEPVPEELNALCRVLLDSLENDDIVAYSQCWWTLDQQISRLKKMAPDFSEADYKRFKEKFHRRNAAVRASFDIIREHVGKDAKLEFVAAKGRIITGTYRNVTVTGFSSLNLVFKADAEEWTLHIDDGNLLDGRWYLIDDLVDLENDKKRVSLR